MLVVYSTQESNITGSFFYYTSGDLLLSFVVLKKWFLAPVVIPF